MAAAPYMDYSNNEKGETELSLHMLDFSDTQLLINALENYKAVLMEGMIRTSDLTVGDINGNNNSITKNSVNYSDQYNASLKLIAALRPPIRPVKLNSTKTCSV